MSDNIESMQRLINAFTYLPGVGRKTAERYAYSILNLSQEDVDFFANSLKEVKRKVRFCSICGNFTDDDICDICKTRKSDIICVVKEPKDVLAIEKAKNFNGLYHVLHGTINPLEGKGPNDIRIKELLQRVQSGDIKEVIVATDTDVEGEVTASYIAQILKPLNIKVTRIAQGISMGSALQYADEVTLSKAIQDRKEM
ncbi:MAG: recombination mediator RecR [Firmicutes bacterium]|nr:recombination mediator RecR [Bacillota bacterium]MDY5041572.1 recombination mediator RecR [Eubacteriales bacterium]